MFEKYKHLQCEQLEHFIHCHVEQIAKAWPIDPLVFTSRHAQTKTDFTFL